jgi:hypothetical protein
MPHDSGQIGDMCSNDNQCASLVCAGLHQESGAWIPGSCGDKKILGDFCSQNYQCASSYCDTGNNTSRTDRCMPYQNGQDGNICSNDSQCISLVCAGLHQQSGAWIPGSCAGKKALGDFCSQNYQCTSGYCDTGNNTSRTDRCMPHSGGQLGDICSNANQCSSLICAGLHQQSGAWVPGSCASKLTLGDPCTQNYECGSGYCDRGNNTSRTDRCMPNQTGRPGDICSHPNQCISRTCLGLHQQGNNWIPGSCN